MSPRIVDDSQVKKLLLRQKGNREELRALVEREPTPPAKEPEIDKTLLALVSISRELRAIGDGVKPTNVSGVEASIKKLADALDKIAVALAPQKEVLSWSFDVERGKDGLIKGINAKAQR